MKEIHIFAMNDCDWVAAETMQQAKQCLADHVDRGVVDEKFEQDFLDEPYKLSPLAMDKLKYIGDEDNPYEKPVTFTQELKNRIDAGEKFPQFFASTEY